jgi:hypothetical protein
MRFHQFETKFFSQSEVTYLSKTNNYHQRLAQDEFHNKPSLHTLLFFIVVYVEKMYVLNNHDEIEFVKKSNNITNYLLYESFVNAIYLDDYFIENLEVFQPSVLYIVVNEMYGGHIYLWHTDKVINICGFRCLLPHLTDEFQQDIKLEEIIFGMFLRRLKIYAKENNIKVLRYIAPSLLLQGILKINNFETYDSLFIISYIKREKIGEALPCTLRDIVLPREDHFLIL